MATSTEELQSEPILVNHTRGDVANVAHGLQPKVEFDGQSTYIDRASYMMQHRTTARWDTLYLQVTERQIVHHGRRAV